MTETTIRKVLGENARLDVSAESIPADDDLFEAGMTSHASVNVLLALEDEFDVEFPPELLTRTTFSSVANLADALRQLGVDLSD